MSWVIQNFYFQYNWQEGKKVKKEGGKEKKYISIDVNGYIQIYTHKLIYVCASALHFMERLIITCYKHKSGKIESILQFVT